MIKKSYRFRSFILFEGIRPSAKKRIKAQSFDAVDDIWHLMVQVIHFNGKKSEWDQSCRNEALAQGHQTIKKAVNDTKRPFFLVFVVRRIVWTPAHWYANDSPGPMIDSNTKFITFECAGHKNRLDFKLLHREDDSRHYRQKNKSDLIWLHPARWYQHVMMPMRWGHGPMLSDSNEIHLQRNIIVYFWKKVQHIHRMPSNLPCDDGITPLDIYNALRTHSCLAQLTMNTDNVASCNASGFIIHLT